MAKALRSQVWAEITGNWYVYQAGFADRQAENPTEGMSLVNQQFFVGTRCRLARHKDAKFVTGWVEFFKGESMVVSTDDTLGSTPGDEFYIEAYGANSKACAKAVLCFVEGAEAEPEGDKTGDQSAGRLTFKILGQIKVLDHKESSRIMVNNMYATYLAGDKSVRVRVRDVSPTGIGILAETEFKKDEPISLKIGTAIGPVAATGVVKHVRPHNGKFRVGIELTNLSRLDGTRWRRLFGEAA